MKKINFILLFLFAAYALDMSAQSQTVEIPQGTVVVALRSNDEKSVLYLHNEKIYIDDITNLCSDNWWFYFLGSKDGLTDVTYKPDLNASGWTRRLAIQKGYAFVGRVSGSSFHARFYVAEMITNKEKEIIGARIAYQYPFYTEEELAAREREREARELREVLERQQKEEAEQAALAKAEAEAEARKIFWDGTEVQNDVLRNFYLNEYDTNENGKIEKEEADAVTDFYAEGSYYLYSFECLEKFRKIESVTINGIDIANFNNFRYFTSLKSITIENCPNITSIDFNHQQSRYYSKKIVINNCGLLEIINCNSSSTGELIVSNCPSLHTLLCNVNYMNGLNLLNCANVRHIDCNHNYLKSLNLAGLNKLEYLNCSDNKRVYRSSGFINPTEESWSCMTSLNVAGCSSLKTLHGGDSGVQVIDLSGCVALEELYVENNELQDIDLRDCISLKDLSIRNNNLTSLNVSNSHNLDFLWCSDNDLTSLNVSGCHNLGGLSCDRNKNLTQLDISNNKKLSYIQCMETKISELDISNCQTALWGEIDYAIEMDNDTGRLYLPAVKDGFTTLYVNKNQKIVYIVYDEENNPKQQFIQKMTKADKRWFYQNWMNVTSLTKEDLNFKVKVK